MADRHALEARIVFLHAHECVDDLRWGAAEVGATADRFLDRGEAAVRRQLRISHRIDLLLGERTDQAQGPEHLEVLFEIPRGGLDGRLLRRGELEMESDAEPLAKLGLAPGPAARVAVALDDGTHGPTLGHAAPDEPFDTVLDHEVEAARGGALDGLPALHGMNGPWHEGEVLQIVAAIRDAGGNGVALPLVGERGVVERLEDDLDLLLEELAVGGLVEQRGSERMHLAGVVTTPDPEAYPAAGEHIHHGEVLGQPEGMPHRCDVEPAPHLQPRVLDCEVGGQLVSDRAGYLT